MPHPLDWAEYVEKKTTAVRLHSVYSTMWIQEPSTITLDTFSLATLQKKMQLVGNPAGADCMELSVHITCSTEAACQANMRQLTGLAEEASYPVTQNIKYTLTMCLHMVLLL